MGLSTSKRNVNRTNGHYLCNRYIPEETLILILSYTDAKDLLACSLVCKHWNEIVKSNGVWIEKFPRNFTGRKLKRTTWHAYYALFTGIFDENLLSNLDGRAAAEDYNMMEFYGDHCLQEESQWVAFKGHGNDGFVLPPKAFDKMEINLSRAAQFVLNHTRPYIYVSQLMCEKIDCRCKYGVVVDLYYVDGGHVKEVRMEKVAEAQSDTQSTKFEFVIKNYPKNIFRINFKPKRQDQKLWLGHYGDATAGGVVKFLFDSIQESPYNRQIIAFWKLQQN